MAEERTDNQILDAEPVKCQLGDKTFELKPQPNMKGRKFRKAYEEIQERLVTTNSIVATDEMIDLIYDYDRSLGEKKKWIQEHATDDQLVEVFAVIYGFAVGPFVKRLPAALAKVQGLDEAVLRERIEREILKQ